MTHAVKFIAVLLFLSIFSLSGAAAANPDQSGVEQQLLLMKKQMEQMQKKMQDLQSQLETAQQNAAAPSSRQRRLPSRLTRRLPRYPESSRLLMTLQKNSATSSSTAMFAPAGGKATMRRIPLT